MEKYLVVTIRDNIVEDTFECDDETEAKDRFLALCRENLTNFDAYDSRDIEHIIDNGYETHGNGSICIINLCKPTISEDAESVIAAAKIEDEVPEGTEDGEEVNAEVEIKGRFTFSIHHSGLPYDADVKSFVIGDALNAFKLGVEHKPCMEIDEVKAVIY